MGTPQKIPTRTQKTVLGISLLGISTFVGVFNCTQINFSKILLKFVLLQANDQTLLRNSVIEIGGIIEIKFAKFCVGRSKRLPTRW